MRWPRQRRPRRDWRHQTQELLADPRTCDLTSSGPWQDVARLVPVEETRAWWHLAWQASGWVHTTVDGGRLLPGGGLVRHVAYALVQRDDIPFTELGDIPVGVIAEILPSMVDGAGQFTPAHVAERIDSAYTPGTAEKLLHLWNLHPTPALWWGCHHPLDDLLTALSAPDADNYVTLCEPLLQRFTVASREPLEGQALRRQLADGISSSGSWTDPATFALCRPRYVDQAMQAKVEASEQARAGAGFGFLPCATALVDIAATFTTGPPRTQLVASLLRQGSTLSIDELFTVASAIDHR